MAVRFRISRFNPQLDTTPRFQEYSLDIPAGSTLLDCINLIKWTQDGTLAYRMSCRSAICGSCAMVVNGHAMLACKAQASEVVIDGAITIEPLGNLKVVKDLVVDLEPFWDSLKRVKPWLQPDIPAEYERERLQSDGDYKRIEDASTCILCASCYSDCNVLGVDEKFMGPATLAKAQRFVYDTRDSKADERLEVLSRATGLWDCTHCAECSTRCPTDANPLERITELKTASMIHRFHKNSGARHLLAFRESIPGRFFGLTGGGLINENYIPLRSVGFFNITGLIELIPVGIRMFMRGKQAPLKPHKIKKFGEVRRMFRRFREYLK